MPAQTVSNVQVRQEGFEIIVTYDLDGELQGEEKVMIGYSKDGRNYKNFTDADGDLGKYVKPGTGRKISFLTNDDYAGHDARFKVFVSSARLEKEARDWFQKGYDAEEYDKKISFYEKAIELDPDSKAYNNMGYAYHQQGNLTKAIELYEKTIELKPDYALAYYNMGSAYNNQGN